MDRDKLIDGIIEVFPPARDKEKARVSLNGLNDDQLSDLHGRITTTHARAVDLLTHREERTKARKAMIGELANAYVNDPFSVQSVSYQFEDAVAHFDKLTDDELTKKYAGLKAIDAIPPINDSDIIWSDGADDEAIPADGRQHFIMT